MDTIIVPAASPVTIEMIAEMGIIDPGLDATRIQRLINAGTDLCQQYSGVALLPQTRRCIIDSADGTLPKSPVIAILSLSGYNSYTHTTTTLVAGSDTGVSDYYLHTQKYPNAIEFLTSYWRPAEVTCTYVCGYVDASHIPSNLISGIINYVLENYENPTAGISLATYKLFTSGGNIRIR